ncbi:MAG: hypothetical protein JSV38_00815 [Desulfobacterales bacterium]|nr:MAG: hypothetical protein JSV38_00815 [Desulfobacterales bacterium]
MQISFFILLKSNVYRGENGKHKKTRKGVTSKKEYRYARIDGHVKCCRKGERGKKFAEVAKAKEIARKYENNEINAGMKVKRVGFEKVQDISK